MIWGWAFFLLHTRWSGSISLFVLTLFSVILLFLAILFAFLSLLASLKTRLLLIIACYINAYWLLIYKVLGEHIVIRHVNILVKWWAWLTHRWHKSKSCVLLHLFLLYPFLNEIAAMHLFIVESHFLTTIVTNKPCFVMLAIVSCLWLYPYCCCWTITKLFKNWLTISLELLLLLKYYLGFFL